MLAIKNFTVAAFSLAAALVIFTGCQPPGPKALTDGDQLTRDGKYDAAIEKLKVATQLLPKTAQAWNHLGLAYQHAGRASDAMAAYDRALQLDRNLSAARFNLGVLRLEHNDAGGAVSDLTTFTVLQPKSYEGWRELAMAQYRARRWDDAERSAQAALKLQPRSPEMLNLIGLARVQLRRPSEAVPYFQNALVQRGDYSPALLNLAVVAQQYLKNRQYALQKYREYIASQPPPEQLESVRQIVVQLEAELQPRPVATLTNTPPRTVIARSTNAPSITNNATPPRIAETNPAPVEKTIALKPVPEPPPKTNPPPVQAEAPAPVPTPAPPKVPVVLLDEEPAPRIARDVQTPAPAPKSEPANDAPKVTAANLPPLISPAARPASKPPKPGILERANPMNWFGSKKEKEKPGPATRTSAPEVKVAEAPKKLPPPEPDNSPQTWEAARTQLSGPRYTYRHPAKPAPGDQRTAAAAIIKGVEAQQQRQLKLAIEQYKAALKADPANFDAAYDLGLAAYQSRDVPQALSAYELAIVIDPASVDARYNFALALIEGNYASDAAEELNRLVAAHGNEVRAHFALANLYAQQFNLVALARKHYRKVLELNPQHSHAAHIRYWLSSNPG